MSYDSRQLHCQRTGSQIHQKVEHYNQNKQNIDPATDALRPVLTDYAPPTRATNCMHMLRFHILCKCGEHA
jgi:hypothetical protein